MFARFCFFRLHSQVCVLDPGSIGINLGFGGEMEFVGVGPSATVHLDLIIYTLLVMKLGTFPPNK